MKIIGLKVDGIRKLSCIEMEFKDKGLIQIKGKNKQGKTTVLDTIEWLITGNKALNSDIIQHGKESAVAVAIIGDYQIRRVTGKQNKFEVKNLKTGMVEKGEVQNFISTFINELTLNPRPFLDKTPQQQLKFCMDLFKIDYSAIDKELVTLESERTFVGRELKSFGEVVLPQAVKEVDVNALFNQRKEIEQRNSVLMAEYQSQKDEELKEIESFNKEQRTRASYLTQLKSNISQSRTYENNLVAEIERLELQLKQARESLENQTKNTFELQQKYDNAPTPETEKPLLSFLSAPELESTSDIDVKIQNAQAINEKARNYIQALGRQTMKAAKDAEYIEYTGKIVALRDKKLEMLRAVKTGVNGLEIREEGLYYNGVYSENWSDSESLRISSELCIAQLPALRAIFIDRAESFDSDSLAELEKWAIEKDIQAFVTIVSDIPETLDADCFYITEGHLLTKESE